MENIAGSKYNITLAQLIHFILNERPKAVNIDKDTRALCYCNSCNHAQITPFDDVYILNVDNGRVFIRAECVFSYKHN